jgi:hypothetical protein
MNDPYRISEEHRATPAAPRTGWLRPLLWLVLIVSAGANAASSSLGRPLIGVAFGVLTVATATALVVHHYRNRRRTSPDGRPAQHPELDH